jgi:hypothetical protein
MRGVRGRASALGSVLVRLSTGPRPRGATTICVSSLPTMRRQAHLDTAETHRPVAGSSGLAPRRTSGPRRVVTRARRGRADRGRARFSTSRPIGLRPPRVAVGSRVADECWRVGSCPARLDGPRGALTRLREACGSRASAATAGGHGRDAARCPPPATAREWRVGCRPKPRRPSSRDDELKARARGSLIGG